MRVANTFLLALLLVVISHDKAAGRMLAEDTALGSKVFSTQSLHRGEVPPSGASGCTFIPGTGGTDCPITERHNSAVPLRRRNGAPAYPDLIVPFGTATNQ